MHRQLKKQLLNFLLVMCLFIMVFANEVFAQLLRPRVNSITPNKIGQGQTLDIEIEGILLIDVIGIEFSPSGITVNSFDEVSPSILKANITASPTASAGSRTITVNMQNSLPAVASGLLNVLVPPKVTSVSPNSGNPGQTLNVSIIGTDFVDVQSVSFGPGITVNGVPTVINPTQIQANITIDPTALAGPRNVTVTTIAGPSTGGNGLFTVGGSGGGGGCPYTFDPANKAVFAQPPPSFSIVSPPPDLIRIGEPVTMQAVINFVGLRDDGIACWIIQDAAPSEKGFTWRSNGPNSDQVVATFSSPGTKTVIIRWGLEGAAPANNAEEWWENVFQVDVATAPPTGTGSDICAELRNTLSPMPPIQVGMADLDTGDLFQTWFLDVCVVDGFLSKVREVDVVHKVEEVDVVHKVEEVDTVHLLERFLKTGITTPTGIEVTASSTQTIDQVLWEFMSKFKDYNEKFTFDFFQALFEKGLKVEIEDKLLEGIKAFELAKIEKAREDVNKLIYETMKELKDQPLVITDFSGEDSPLHGSITKILRLRGIAVDYRGNCPHGIKIDNQGSIECWVVKQSSRVVENLDDYLYEEPLQRARDLVMCMLAPWNHFPLGEYMPLITSGGAMASSTEAIDDFEFGKTEGYCDENMPYPYDTERDTVLNECSTAYICAMARRKQPRPDMFSQRFPVYKETLCPSDRIKEDIKRELITSLTRKHKFLDRLPPEIWYYGVSMYQSISGPSPDWTPVEYDSFVSTAGAVPVYIFNQNFCEADLGGTNISKNNCLPYDFSVGVSRCAFIMENLLGSGQQATLSQFILGTGPPLWRDFLSREISEFYPTLALSLEVKRAHRLSIDPQEYELAQENKNNLDGLKRMLYGAISTVISQIKEKNTLKFTTGAGIKPLHYTVGWNVCEDANRIEALRAGAGQAYCFELASIYQVCKWENNSCQGAGYYYFETDDIISPAIFLLNKISASIQSEFALAMMAWKKEPEGVMDANVTLVCPEPGCVDVTQAAYGDAGDDNTSAIASTTTNIAVTNNTIFYVGDIIFIDENGNGIWDRGIEEVMRVLEDKGSELVVERGLYGTIPQNYTANHNIFRFDANIYNCWRPEPADNPTYCAFTVRNDLTGKVFRPDLKIDIKERTIVELPEKLPAPWEDLGRYLNLKNGFQTFIDNYCPSLTNQDQCEKQLYLNRGGMPFCEWDPNALHPNGRQGLCKYRGSILEYDSDSPAGVYNNYRTGEPTAPEYNYRTGERTAPEYIGRGQYFNRLYREGFQLFEKPMDQVILDWFEPENRCIRRPLWGNDPCGNLDTNPECIIDVGMNLCRLKTCEEIDNIGDPDKRRQACNANPICTVRDDLLNPDDPVCRRK